MGFTDLFIKRPVLAIVVSLVIIIAGLQAVSSLSVRQYPKSDNAAVTVETIFLGADADTMRGFITAPIERAIAGADGIEFLESVSSLSYSKITARLRLNHDGLKALSEISSKVDQIRSTLPAESQAPSINLEAADSQFAAAYLSFSSDILRPNEITDYLSRNVQPRLSALPGVQRAEIIGARSFAMRVWLKPDRMAAFNISPSEVRRAIARENYVAGLGVTKGALINLNVTANTDMRSIDEFKRLVVRESDGAVVRLEDLADVVMGAESYDSDVRFSGQTAMFMGIFPMPNANVVDVIARARVEMDSIVKDLPKGLSGIVAYDSTKYIENAISEVVTTLLETLAIVMLVIFLFIGSVRATLVPAVVIPISLIGAVFLMQIFGFTVNLLTLLAIVLSVGIVVDDAIVVLENVERHLREGLSPMKAALKGARELTGPVIAMTVTLAAVYAPIGLQGGLTGTLFREFAFTLAGAVMISGVVALTLSPMMASRMISERSERRWLPRHVNSGFEALRERYGKFLEATLKARPAVYFFWIGITILAGIMYTQSPRELAPTEDQGVIFGFVETPSDASLERMIDATAEANTVFMGVPETEFSFQLTFAKFGFGGMALKPWDERDRTVFEILPEVQAGAAQLTDIRMYPSLPSALPGGGQMPVEFVIASTADHERLVEFANQILGAGMGSGKFAFLSVDTRMDDPRREIVLDRDKIADMGLSMEQVGADLSVLLSGNYVNRFNLDGQSYKVIPMIQRESRLTTDQILDTYVSGPGGQLIPLRSIATIESSAQPRGLNRFQQLNSVKITGVAIAPLDDALAVLEAEAQKVLPQGYLVDYTGESRQLRTEGNQFLVTLALAGALIYLVLAAQFNSFRDPFVILAGSAPLAMFGALVFTFLKMPGDASFWTDGWTTTLNIYTQVGLITLIGLVSKNGILIVEFANQLQQEGHSKFDAALGAAKTRLRPVLMTTLATVFGHLPLTLVTGAGAEARNSIGLVLVGGMSIGTLFTLFVIPSLYMLIAKDHSQDRSQNEDEIDKDPVGDVNTKAYESAI